MATIDQVVRQLMAADMPPLPDGHPVASGKIVRYGPKKKAWYVLHEYRSSRNNRVYYFGAYGIWRGAESNSTKFETDYEGMDAGEADRLKRSMAAQEADERAKRSTRADHAANRAKQQYDSARASGESPYLKRKGVEPDKGLRFLSDGTLLVPMVRYDVTDDQMKDPEYRGPKRLCGLQKIAPDGSKLFNRGMAKEGCCFRLGREPKEGELLIVVEGVATGLTVRQATGRSRPVFVAFDAGSLVPVARILRALYPTSPFLFCADDDAYLEAQLNKRLRGDYGVEQPTPDALYTVGDAPRTYAIKSGPLTVQAGWNETVNGVRLINGAVTVGEGARQKVHPFVVMNAGRMKAFEAAALVQQACVCWPVFASRKITPDPDAPKLTDFNDLHAHELLSTVERQLEDAISMTQRAAAGLPAMASGGNAGGKKGGKKSQGAAAVPGLDGGRADDGGAGGDGVEWRQFWHLVSRFTLIYPTDTAYDHQLGDIVKVDHMRLKFGAPYVSMWLNSKKRRDVDLPDVVFDPTQKAKPPQLNLFRGMGVEPSREGSCKLMLELLHYLCGENPDDTNTPVTDWVLKWLAYPLQHPGAKMQTALVFHGKQGAGKNLFFGAVRDIYGAHGGTITQRQLEDRFNAWQSAKLFVIANEVVTRQEMHHHVGLLKNLITEGEIFVNRKMRDERMEKNQMQLVFFSNAHQAMQLEPDDRRLMVIRTPPTLHEAYYVKVAAEVRAGGAAALYRYLLDYPLDGFKEHSKPLMTDAKWAMIEISMNGPQLFWQDIHDKEIDLPYIPGLGEDVYRCFQMWCRRKGEKMPARENRFIPDFMSMNGVRRKTMRVPAISRGFGGTVEVNRDPAKYKQRRVLLMGDLPKTGDLDEWVREQIIEFHKAANAYCRGEDQE